MEKKNSREVSEVSDELKYLVYFLSPILLGSFLDSFNYDNISSVEELYFSITGLVLGSGITAIKSGRDLIKLFIKDYRKKVLKKIS